MLQFLKKEFLENISGPKFLITFAISSILILTSIFTGYEIYKSELEWYTQAKTENLRALEHSGGYYTLKADGTREFREPIKLSILVRGIDSSLGRSAIINDRPDIKLVDSRYSLNPVFSMFGEMDLTFIVNFVLSLIALIFSYNTISGERELGTLKQVMSYPVGKISFIAGKSLGGLITLLVAFYIPLIIGLLFLSFQVSFSLDEWLRIALIVLFFSIYLGFFYLLGMFMSTLNKHSIVSFMFCIALWICSIVVIPKASIEIASHISPPPSINKFMAEKASLKTDYNKYIKKHMEKYFAEHGVKGFEDEGFDRAHRKYYGEAKEIRSGKESALINDYMRTEQNLIKTIESCALFSPSSNMSIAVSRLAGTDTRYKDNLLQSLKEYQKAFTEYATDMLVNNPDKRGGATFYDLDDNGNLTVGVPVHELDLSEKPLFKENRGDLDSILNGMFTNLGVLVMFSLICFTGTFVAFIKYDVR